MSRIYLGLPIVAGADLVLPAAPSRHVQVLRLQPGDPLTLFDGSGGEWRAVVVQMARTAVTVRAHTHVDVDRELRRRVTLAFGMPANERMDAVIEKATELGVAAIQPLVCERSVLRLSGERAARRLEHWRAIAASASEQCGRTRVAEIGEVSTLRSWLERGAATSAGALEPVRLLLSPTAVSRLDRKTLGAPDTELLVLSGPEGGLTPLEEEQARESAFAPVSLGPRILRADTAPLAVLAWCGMEPAAAV
jgi:16S rRNA (uracil1498-N3)-methyltransferase